MAPDHAYDQGKSTGKIQLHTYENAYSNGKGQETVTGVTRAHGACVQRREKHKYRCGGKAGVCDPRPSVPPSQVRHSSFRGGLVTASKHWVSSRWRCLGSFNPCRLGLGNYTSGGWTLSLKFQCALSTIFVAEDVSSQLFSCSHARLSWPRPSAMMDDKPLNPL